MSAPAPLTRAALVQAVEAHVSRLPVVESGAPSVAAPHTFGAAPGVQAPHAVGLSIPGLSGGIVGTLVSATLDQLKAKLPAIEAGQIALLRDLASKLAVGEAGEIRTQLGDLALIGPALKAAADQVEALGKLIGAGK